jgi:hypothetical protein
MKSKLTIDKYGAKIWKLPSGKRHREDGPACEYSDGSKGWYINDELHREDGPAIDNGDGVKCWYLDNVEYTEQDYKYKMRSNKLKKLI